MARNSELSWLKPPVPTPFRVTPWVLTPLTILPYDVFFFQLEQQLPFLVVDMYFLACWPVLYNELVTVSYHGSSPQSPPSPVTLVSLTILPYDVFFLLLEHQLPFLVVDMYFLACWLALYNALVIVSYYLVHLQKQRYKTN